MPRSVSGEESNHDDIESTSAARPRLPSASPNAFRRYRLNSQEPCSSGYQSPDPVAEVSETTSLLSERRDGSRPPPIRSYTTMSVNSSPDVHIKISPAVSNPRRSRQPSRAVSRRPSMDTNRPENPVQQSQATSKTSASSGWLDERTWYDQFTSTDWVHDSIADGARLRALRSRKDIRGRLLALFDGAQGWILVAVIGCLTATAAYFVDVTEDSMFDLKEGFCTTRWFRSRKHCCLHYSEECPAWKSWSWFLTRSGVDDKWIDYAMFVFWAVLYSIISCALTLLTKTVVPSSVSLSTLDENLGAESRGLARGDRENASPPASLSSAQNASPSIPTRPDMVYYSAAGSGVAEVKVINSGFVLHGYLGLKTLVVKTIALIFSVSSGLSIGKEGPYVHIGTCIGNICCRLFSKFNRNDGKRREVLSASAASGVAVAFGAPLGGVLFSLEEVSYYFHPKILFRTFFCCIAAALSLKGLNPYGTGKIVLFQVRYITDWQFFEMGLFILLGVLGGAVGAVFIKASRLWARSFRRIPIIKRWPMLEVILVALLTGLLSFWNRYTKLPVSELMYELASSCTREDGSATGLCPAEEEIGGTIRYLMMAFVIKSLLTVATFGIKVPAGIYVPSMVVGGLMGRIVGHVAQYYVNKYPTFFLYSSCPAVPGMESCVVPGVYAMVAAGATMCGVTRLSVTLAVILFELTGSLEHVLPFSLAVLCAKWTADAIEPRSIYDMLTDMNSYPILDNKLQILTDAELGDIVRPVRRSRVIDISNSPFVPARHLRAKLDYLLMAGELDGGLPILRHNILKGLIPAPDLEFALDNLEDEENTLCLMTIDASWTANTSDEETDVVRVDFGHFVDPAPLALDIHSPMDLVYQCFAKLGLRYLCVLRNGQYAGMVHKKTFVKFMKENE